MTWTVRALGSAEGEILLPEGRAEIRPGTEMRLDTPPLGMICRKGKLGDSEDSFLFLFAGVDPRKENFRLSARLTAAASEDPGYQAGFGLMAADTVASESGYCRQRNHLLNGVSGRRHEAGLRAVSGYRRADAMEPAPVRCHDASRRFPVPEWCPDASMPRTYSLTLEKTDRGFTAACDGEQIRLEGCDFLTVQDREMLYAGIALAGELSLTLNEVSLERSPGRLSHTPKGTLKHALPEYPFPARLVLEEPLPDRRRGGTIIVTPDGTPRGDGSPQDPSDLATALRSAAAGARILLEDGFYSAEEPFQVPPEICGSAAEPITLRARHPGKAVLDGTRQKTESPLFLLRADHWVVEGLVFAHAPGSGLLISGSHNTVRRCEARENGDTGILLCAWPGAERPDWPSGNRIEDCDSHDNCDPVRRNADGFGAKIRIGAGNRFQRCMAWHNIDDGFDLYAKSAVGEIPPVSVESCLAYENGFLAGEEAAGRGIGFKLGGENQAAAHEVRNCLAYGNGRSGFSSNSNPACRLYGCTSAYNGDRKKAAQFSFSTGRKPAWKKRRLFPVCFPGAERFFIRTDPVPAPARKPDGSIAMHGLFTPRLRFPLFGADLERRQRRAAGNGKEKEPRCSVS